MEKASIIFSILTHDYEFMKWFWLFATFPAGLLQLFCFKSKEQLTEKELIEMSSDFDGISEYYIGYSIVAVCLFIFLPFMVLSPGLNNWSIQKFGIEFYPSIVMFSAGYGIYQSLFALLKGVYPMGKFRASFTMTK